MCSKKDGRKERKARISCPLCKKNAVITQIEAELNEPDGEETSLTKKWGTPTFNVAEHAKNCQKLKGSPEGRRMILVDSCTERYNKKNRKKF